MFYHWIYRDAISQTVKPYRERLKLSNIEFNKGTVLFIFDVPKPFYNAGEIFPLVHVQQFN